MQSGDLVIHKATGQRLTIKDMGRGSGMVLCRWTAIDRFGNPSECTAAYNWLDLRLPMPEEMAPAPGVTDPATTRAAADASKLEVHPAADASPLQESDGRAAGQRNVSPPAAADTSPGPAADLSPRPTANLSPAAEQAPPLPVHSGPPAKAEPIPCHTGPAPEPMPLAPEPPRRQRKR